MPKIICPTCEHRFQIPSIPPVTLRCPKCRQLLELPEKENSNPVFGNSRDRYDEDFEYDAPSSATQEYILAIFFNIMTFILGFIFGFELVTEKLSDSTIKIILFSLFFSSLFGYLYTLAWVAHDTRERGEAPNTLTAVVAGMGIIAFLAWPMIRPKGNRFTHCDFCQGRHLIRLRRCPHCATYRQI